MVLGADLNARMGTNDCTLYAQQRACLPSEGEIGLPLVRSSKDPKSNYAGLLLNQMTLRTNLYILSGSFGIDYPAEFTFVAGTKMSQIDYFIVSSSLLPGLKELEVIPKFTSDHLPILLSLNLPIHHSRSVDLYIPLQSLEGGIFSRHRWSPRLSQELSKLLASESKKQSIQVAFLLGDHKLEVLDLYQDLVSKLKQLFTRSITRPPPQACLSSKHWFDQECVDAKKGLLNLYQAYKFSADPKIAQNLILQKKTIQKATGR